MQGVSWLQRLLPGTGFAMDLSTHTSGLPIAACRLIRKACFGDTRIIEQSEAVGAPITRSAVPAAPYAPNAGAVPGAPGASPEMRPLRR